MESVEDKIINNSKRIVIKVGSALIAGKDPSLINNKILTTIVSEIIKLHNIGKEILLVSSGALALGKKSLKIKNYLKRKEIKITVDLGLGKNSFDILTCDLSHKYIDINASYKS